MEKVSTSPSNRVEDNENWNEDSPIGQENRGTEHSHSSTKAPLNTPPHTPTSQPIRELNQKTENPTEDPQEEQETNREEETNREGCPRTKARGYRIIEVPSLHIFKIAEHSFRMSPRTSEEEFIIHKESLRETFTCIYASLSKLYQSHGKKFDYSAIEDFVWDEEWTEDGEIYIIVRTRLFHKYLLGIERLVEIAQKGASKSEEKTGEEAEENTVIFEHRGPQLTEGLPISSIGQSPTPENSNGWQLSAIFSLTFLGLFFMCFYFLYKNCSRRVAGKSNRRQREIQKNKTD